jgi:uncharacterized protein YyaL (SSP411 family)
VGQSPIQWLPWGTDAFARAARERKPVLLSIVAAWCRACHEMDRTTYADADVQARVASDFIPVRVDADQRPDINERYNLGGWPTTAFLTPAGAMITGGTFVPADRMPGVLARVAAAFGDTGYTDTTDQGAADNADQRAADNADDTDQGATDCTDDADQGAADYTDDADADRPIVESIFSSYDEEYGGFGVEPKFPHTAPLHLAMAMFRERPDPRWQRVVEHTLDRMAGGGLWDPAGGGFYRYASTRDWQLPHHEKLLETNAALLRAYAEAAALFGRPEDRERCAAIARFITTTLRAEGGGYIGSDADRILYADANASAVGALLGAATVLDDSGLAREALASFERVMLACYSPGRGLAHYFDGAPRVRGLLVDQVAGIGGLLDAHEVSDAEPYRMMAEELGHFIVRDLWDAADGGFFDRVPALDDVGLLRSRRKPFLENADAALVLGRLARLEPRKGFPDPAAFLERASGALRVAAHQLERQGPLAARYALARRHLIN